MTVAQSINFQRGAIINGRYEIVQRLAAGSMAIVYGCADHEMGGKMVALKVLLPEVARDAVSLARFRTELVAAYSVNHPNVVRVYEYFRDGDIAAYTMEYVDGGDLADLIDPDQPPPIDEVVRLLCQICSGVQAIHDHGIIHRDLKPENILLTTRGDAKISDFGIVRTQVGRKLTAHGGVVGTIDYVSPEYIGYGHLDARSDIYGVGVLAYRLITGIFPFKAGTLFETVALRLKEDARAPSMHRPLCPPALDGIVLKALARDPKERYQSMREMLCDLVELLPARFVKDLQESENVLAYEEELPLAAHGAQESAHAASSKAGKKRPPRIIKVGCERGAPTTFLDVKSRMKILTADDPSIAQEHDISEPENSAPENETNSAEARRRSITINRIHFSPAQMRKLRHSGASIRKSRVFCYLYAILLLLLLGYFDEVHALMLEELQHIDTAALFKKAASIYSSIVPR